MEKYAKIIAALRSEQRALVVGHEDPDCDSIGSTLGLCQVFNQAGHQWRPVCSGNMPANLSFLPGIKQMLDPEQIEADSYDAVVLVDCSQYDRVGPWLAPLCKGKHIYCLDHHEVKEPVGLVNVVEPEAAATAELLTALCLEAGLTISDDAALCFYAALAADSGGFRFRNTSARCLQMAARLRPQIDTELIRIQLFEDRSWANLKMLSAALREMQVECNGRLCYSFLSREEMQKHGAGYNDCHNIVNSLLELSGVKMGLMFEEYDGFVKMSFRCRDGYRVDQLAALHHGGGHMLASGCKENGSLAQVMPQVLADARKLFS